MKKIFALFIALTYLAVSSGVVVNMHYCMGELADISYNTPADTHCGICGMDDSGCCHDDIKVVKLEDNHKSAATINFQLPAVETPIAHNSVYTFKAENTYPVELLYFNHPPDLYTPPLTILHSVFRI